MVRKIKIIKMDIKQIKIEKQNLWEEYHERLEAFDCNLSHGIGRENGEFCISLTIQREGGFSNKLIEKIETFLPNEWNGCYVRKSYGDIPVAQ